MTHDLEPILLEALHADPGDETTWLALADWFEESSTGAESTQTLRAQLVRLSRQLRAQPVMRRTRERVILEEQLIELLRGGIQPPIPEVTNSVGMRLALIPPGRFRMGAPADEGGRMEEEGPLHEVEITRPFYLGVFQVTQEQYEQLMGNNPSHFSGTGASKAAYARLDTRRFPVERVSWYEAVAFCGKLSELPAERQAGRTYRLPTEAEWEYACRGGPCTTTPFYLGSSICSHQANFDGTHPHGDGKRGPYLVRTCAVGSYFPNLFGLYDMAGNVWEWCADWFAEDYYRHSPRVDPPGPPHGQRRVLRGGAFWNWGSCCRCARRVRNTPESREQAYGFRVAMTRGG